MSEEEPIFGEAEEPDNSSSVDEADAQTSIDELLDDISFANDVAASSVEVAIKERDQYLDALQRLQADFENFRKRTTRQQSELLDRASLSLVERLLPVLDALDLALTHAKSQGEEDKQDELLSALVQIAGLARTTLEREGLERIDETEIPFDPTIHDAVSRVEVDDEAATHEPTVVDVMRVGYRLKGKVIRPAMVSVKG